jgi:hypothetical protein
MFNIKALAYLVTFEDRICITVLCMYPACTVLQGGISLFKRSFGAYQAWILVEYSKGGIIIFPNGWDMKQINPESVHLTLFLWSSVRFTLSQMPAKCAGWAFNQLKIPFVLLTICFYSSKEDQTQEPNK